jgi:hypothetical protein
MSCWRCGKETPEGVIECPEHTSTQFTYSHGNLVRKIDWSKVNSVEDFKRIFAVFGMQVVTGSPAEEALREFLED